MRKALPFLVVAIAMLALWSTPAYAQPQVMRFTGAVTLEGRAAPDGTRIVAEVQVGNTWREAASTTSSGGYYTLTIGLASGESFPTGAPIRFRVGQFTADQTASWEPGALRTNFNLTVSERIENQLASIRQQLVRVWGYEAQTQTWRMYDPAFPEASDLPRLERGRGYWVAVNADVTLVFSGNQYFLVRGWNLIGWLG